MASLLAIGLGCLLAASIDAQTPALKEAFRNDFLIGVAVNESQFTGRDTNGAALIVQQFNAVSPENVLKWEATQSRSG